MDNHYRTTRRSVNSKVVQVVVAYHQEFEQVAQELCRLMRRLNRGYFAVPGAVMFPWKWNLDSRDDRILAPDAETELVGDMDHCVSMIAVLSARRTQDDDGTSLEAEMKKMEETNRRVRVWHLDPDQIAGAEWNSLREILETVGCAADEQLARSDNLVVSTSPEPSCIYRTAVAYLEKVAQDYGDRPTGTPMLPEGLSIANLQPIFLEQPLRSLSISIPGSPSSTSELHTILQLLARDDTRIVHLRVVGLRDIDHKPERLVRLIYEGQVTDSSQQALETTFGECHFLEGTAELILDDSDLLVNGYKPLNRDKVKRFAVPAVHRPGMLAELVEVLLNDPELEIVDVFSHRVVGSDWSTYLCVDSLAEEKHTTQETLHRKYRDYMIALVRPGISNGF